MSKEADQKFKQGDVVRLKSGGPKMTVYFYQDNYGQKGRVVCEFFADNEKKQELFEENMLELVGEE